MLSKINDSIKKGMLVGDKEAVEALRLVKAELLVNEKTATPRPDMEVVKSYSKKLTKALDAFANRPDQLVKLQKELEIVNALLPVGVPEQTIRDYAETVIQNLRSAVGARPNPGFVIKSVKLHLPDADGSTVAKVVNECLK
jgi:uncharacterized protein YqeY